MGKIQTCPHFMKQPSQTFNAETFCVRKYYKVHRRRQNKQNEEKIKVPS